MEKNLTQFIHRVILNCNRYFYFYFDKKGSLAIIPRIISVRDRIFLIRDLLDI